MLTEEAAGYHALSILLGGEYRKLKKEWDRFESWKKAFLARDPAGFPLALQNLKEIERGGIRLILSSESGFPEVLREIPWPPFGLYVRGNFFRPEEICIAIVGTRKATEEGKSFAGKVASSLADAGVTVVSGLALGIDAAAHQAVSDQGHRTIAVLANGVDSIYPRENEKIGEHILSSGGSLVSEYPPGSPALSRRFLERNRIVAGLAKGIVVIEAPERSGSLATARFALEQNRDVFVSPGPVWHPNYEGSHALIKAGASLITSASDILEALGIDTGKPSALTANILGKLDADEKAIINVLMSFGSPMGVPAISEQTGIAPRQLGAALGALVVQGILEDHSGMYAINSNTPQ